MAAFIFRFERKTQKQGIGLYYDPLYGYVPLPQYLFQALDLEFFQRLRYVKQLGTMYLVYPSATHTRFEHSVGVAHLAGIVHKSLEEKLRRIDKPDKPELNEATLAALQLGALFHDIGHGPFGHIFEEFCARSGYEDWSHEAVSSRIIHGEMGQLIHDRVKPTNPTEIPAFLERLAKNLNPGPVFGQLLTPANIHRIGKGLALSVADKSWGNRYRFLADVVPIGFGIDRMDYLRRDSYFTGIPTGNIDIWELVEAMTLSSESGQWRLKLDSSAALAYETLLQVRSFTYRRLYNNPLNRTADELVIRGLAELCGDDGPQRVALFTDHQLLEEFYNRRQQQPLLGDIYHRLQTRKLPETIPLTLKGNMPDRARLRLEERRELRGLAKTEKEIGQKAGLKPPLEIYFHFQEVKAVVADDYKLPHLLHPVTGELESLFTTGDHLKELYDGVFPGGRARHEVYNQKVSPVYLSFPYEAIRERIKDALTQTDGKIEPASELVCSGFTDVLLEGFVASVLRLTGNDRDAMLKVLKSVKQRLRQYVETLVKAVAEEIA